MLLNCAVEEDSWESLGLQGNPTSPAYRKSVLNIHGWTDAEAEAPKLWPPNAKTWLIWKDLDAGKDWKQEEKGTTENEKVGWHHWLNGCESEANSRRWWRTGKLGMLQSMWLQRVGHHWVTKRVGHHWLTKLNWTWLRHENMSTRWTGLYYSLCITSTARNTADTSISLLNERSRPGSQCILHKPVIW